MKKENDKIESERMAVLAVEEYMYTLHDRLRGHSQAEIIIALIDEVRFWVTSSTIADSLRRVTKQEK